tara:strand:- start:120815 stop:121570 length:756 start_codon:yes stop_codon:yes gene_type:complete
MDFRILDGGRKRLLHPDSFRDFLGGKVGITKSNKLVVSALNGVTLDIEDGARLGLIGHNGSGKSTLLRILAGIYEPSGGTVEIDGKVSTLFDVSLGMDMDVSGYDNIRLQGLIFGMTPKEIELAIPDIHEFTQLGDFLGLPIRTYSSGMLTRLSFALATALKPDILLMDEVIGAGDAAFFSRAEARLEKLLGRTNIMVLASHSTGIIREFCTQALVLEQGEVVYYGDVEAAIEAYETRVAQMTDTPASRLR